MLVNMYVLLVSAQRDDQQGIYLQENTFTGKIILFSGKRRLLITLPAAAYTLTCHGATYNDISHGCIKK